MESLGDKRMTDVKFSKDIDNLNVINIVVVQLPSNHLPQDFIISGKVHFVSEIVTAKAGGYTPLAC